MRLLSFNFRALARLFFWSWLSIQGLSAVAPAGQLDQRAVAAQIKAMCGAQVKLAWVRTNNDFLDLLGAGFKDQQRKIWSVMVFDTEEGQERVFAPAAGPDAYCHPLITPNGRRLIWTCGRKDIFIADWDGRNPRLLLNGIKAMAVAEDPPGTEWVYVGEEEETSDGRPAQGGVPLSNRQALRQGTGMEQNAHRLQAGAHARRQICGRGNLGGNPAGWPSFPTATSRFSARAATWGWPATAACGCGTCLAATTASRCSTSPAGTATSSSLTMRRAGTAKRRNGGIRPASIGETGIYFLCAGRGRDRRACRGFWATFSWPNSARTITSVKQWIRVTDVPHAENYPYAWLAPPALAPRILQQPQAQSAQEGETVTLSLQAEGSPAPSFQWQQNGKDIPGATSAAYSLTANRTVKDAQFCCAVKNSLGSAKSQTVTLAVKLKGPAPEALRGLGRETASQTARGPEGRQKTDPEPQ